MVRKRGQEVAQVPRDLMRPKGVSVRGGGGAMTGKRDEHQPPPRTNCSGFRRKRLVVVRPSPPTNCSTPSGATRRSPRGPRSAVKTRDGSRRSFLECFRVRRGGPVSLSPPRFHESSAVRRKTASDGGVKFASP